MTETEQTTTCECGHDNSDHLAPRGTYFLVEDESCLADNCQCPTYEAAR